MKISNAAVMGFVATHNVPRADAKFVPEILSTMAEMEDSKNHAFLKKAQRQEGRLLDEIAEEKVDKKNEKADAGVLAQVGVGISCVYSDGTQGYKCVGVGACVSDDEVQRPVDIDRIACGSCIGFYSCYELSNTTVGEQSCIGDYSCQIADNASIGNNSCHGDNSCRFVNDAEIRNNSCNGLFSCRDVNDAEIGNNSCIKDFSCRDVDLDVGQDSCNGFQSCRLISGKEFANRLTI
jgi:hypothetical protein